MKTQCLLLFVIQSYFITTYSEKILVICHFNSISHNFLLNTISEKLSNREHEITFVTFYPPAIERKNVKHVVIPDISDTRAGYRKTMTTKKGISLNFHNIIIYGKIEEAFFNNTHVKEIIASKEKYDLVILNYVCNSALLGFAYKFKAPIVIFASLRPDGEINKISQNPSPYAYVPQMFSQSATKMNYWQRMQNTFNHLSFAVKEWLFILPVQKRLLKENFLNSPNLEQLYGNVSLILCNTHFSIQGSMPYIPFIQQIGGFHINNRSNKVSEDLKLYLDTARNGIIYFSLGTNLKSELLPKETISNIFKTLSKTPQKILWKFTQNDDYDIPDNIRIDKWFPQDQILSHPNTKLFITHGGLLSITEAVFHKVPILGIPMFLDQFRNVQGMVEKGCGLELSYENLTEALLFKAVTELTNNSSFKANVQLYSMALKEQPVNAEDNLIFWIEYVLRHKTTQFLKSPAINLYWYEYFMLDIFIVFICIVVLVVNVMYFIGKKGLKLCIEVFVKRK